MSTGTLSLIILILVAAMGFWLWIALARYRISRAVAGRVRCSIIRTTGKRISGFVPYDGNATWIKIKDDSIVPIEPPTRMQPKRASKQAQDLIGAGMYMFDDNSLIRSFWPYEHGWMRSLMSVEIAEVIWMEDNPEPITNRRLKELLDSAIEVALQHQGETLPGMTATPKLITSYCDQTTMLITAALEEQYRELQDSFVSLTKKWINPMIVYIGILLGLAGTIAAAVMMYMTSQRIAELKEALGL